MAAEQDDRNFVISPKTKESENVTVALNPRSVFRSGLGCVVYTVQGHESSYECIVSVEGKVDSLSHHNTRWVMQFEEKGIMPFCVKLLLFPYITYFDMYSALLDSLANCSCSRVQELAQEEISSICMKKVHLYVD